MWEGLALPVVIFDVDGTLIDTVPLITRCFQEVFQKYAGKTLSDEAVHAMFGPGESVIFSREFKDRWQEVLQDYLARYTAGQPNLQVSPDIMALLNGLKNLQVTMAIVTNKERDTTAITLDHFDLRGYFAQIVTAQDIVHPKPSPEGINLVLQECGENSADAVMIGDTEHDREAAMAGQVPFVRALWFVPADARPAPGSELSALSVADLKEILPYEL